MRSIAHARHALRPAGPGPLHLGRGPRARADGRVRRHRRRAHARRERQPDRRPSSTTSDIDGARLGPRLSARRARSRSRAPSPATRSPWRCSTCTPRAGAGPRSCPGSGCWPTTSRTPTCASSTSPTATSRCFARTSRSRSTRSSARWASAPRGANAQPVMPPGTFGGNMDTRQLVAGHDALPARPGRRARCSRSGDAHGCQGDGEVCVTGLEAPMYATPALHAREGPHDPGAAVPHRRAADAGVDSARCYGTTGVGGDLYTAAQDAIRAMVEHVSGDVRALARGRLPALQPVRRPEDLRDRRRGRVHRQRAAAGDGVRRLNRSLRSPRTSRASSGR